MRIRRPGTEGANDLIPLLSGEILRNDFYKCNPDLFCHTVLYKIMAKIGPR